MLRIAIVEDEEYLTHKYRKSIARELDSLGIRHEIHLFTDSVLFDQICTDMRLDLVFLDIDMPELSGITLAAKLRLLNRDTDIIFVSALENFVFQSLRYAPFRFIRKERFELELQEAILAFHQKRIEEHHIIRLSLENGRIIPKSVSDIAYFYTMRHDLFFYDHQKTSFRLAVRCYTMEQLEKLMAPFGFLRIHKSYLVNHRFIYQIQKDHVILQPDDEVLPLSRRRASEIRERYRILMREEDSI